MLLLPQSIIVLVERFSSRLNIFPFKSLANTKTYIIIYEWQSWRERGNDCLVWCAIIDDHLRIGYDFICFLLKEKRNLVCFWWDSPVCVYVLLDASPPLLPSEWTYFVNDPLGYKVVKHMPSLWWLGSFRRNS